MRTNPAFLAILAAALCGAPAAAQHDHGPHDGGGAPAKAQDYGDQLGTVRFPTSCSDAARPHLERGLALTHHMTYEGARDAFTTALKADPECAMAYWGVAMSYIHPLWSDPPSEADFERGKTAVEQAKAKGVKTDRERAYIWAVEAYYAAGRNQSEKPNLDAFERSWAATHRQFPDDPEAALFYALAHMATADPGDKTYLKQKESAAIAKKILARIPDHPGAHHYVIHAYDYPTLAENALETARSYGKIAPDVAHALHMPSHIYTRLGLWSESIAMNLKSADAAWRHPAGDKVSTHYPHALDYLVYAYLQRAEDGKAKDIVDKVSTLKGPYQTHLATAYTLAGVPARYALERRQWKEAAALEPRVPAEYPWDNAPAMEALTHFARGIGAARSGDPQAARKEMDRLAALRDRAKATSPYWGGQIEIQRLSVQAWAEYAEGNKEAALQTMRQASEMEARTEKHPVTPGEILPARELYADMLLENEQYQDAHAEYLVTLARSPNRFNALYGAGRAAELAGDKAKAAAHYEKLIALAVDRAERPRLAEAKKLLAKK